MFGNLLKAVVGVVIETPITLAADVLTLGGAITERHEPHTMSALKKVVDNVSKSTD